ncbi:WLM-domain-containing protein [Violaceomyces palustris]|uniref:WLM-domain-containing protein n=1 Tax=Violaceomyces palustris TaxID=1673888 RepID=A0ACD0NM88_9BASI|nr:WLM-domain-containing protein [Violaceomyces palustris]
MPIQSKSKFSKGDPTFKDPLVAHAGRRKGLGGGVGGGRISEYRALKRPGSEEALELLIKVGRLVKPIMIKYGFYLPLLAEFFPKQENLLGININRGQKICLRLRWSHSPEEVMMDEEQVVMVMLHELTHNIISPHDQRFYELLDRMTEEYRESKRCGGRLKGQGFLTPGFKLGSSGSGRGGLLSNRPSSSSSSSFSSSSARRKAVEMAEERRRGEKVRGGGEGGVSGPGGRRLGIGGPSDQVVVVPGEGEGGRTNVSQLAAQAAERRRRRDQVTCPWTEEDKERISQESEEQELIDGVEVITINDDDDDEDGGRRRKRSGEVGNERAKSRPRREGLKGEEGKEPRTSGQGSGSGESDARRAGSSEADPHQRRDVIVISSDEERGEGRRGEREADGEKSGVGRSSVEQDKAAAALRYYMLERKVGEEAEEEEEEERRWNCQACTLLNGDERMDCEVCLTKRPGRWDWT